MGIDYGDLAAIRDLAKPASPFTEASLRWMVFNAKTNGLERAIVRVGKSVYLSKTRFNEWLASQPKTTA